MNTAEFFLAWAFGLRMIFVMGTIAGAVTTVVGALTWAINKNEAAKTQAKMEAGDEHDRKFLRQFLVQEESAIMMGRRILRVGLPLLVICFPLAVIPGPQDLWEYRVAMLKLAVASPQNVAVAGDHIETIVKGLECKYLGQNCPKKEEAK